MGGKKRTKRSFPGGETDRGGVEGNTKPLWEGEGKETEDDLADTLRKEQREHY